MGERDEATRVVLRLRGRGAPGGARDTSYGDERRRKREQERMQYLRSSTSTSTYSYSYEFLRAVKGGEKY